jgi:hypothetical protein
VRLARPKEDRVVARLDPAHAAQDVLARIVAEPPASCCRIGGVEKISCVHSLPPVP